MNDRAALTVLFELTTPAAFRRDLQVALGYALEDYGVPKSVIRTECAAVSGMPLVRLAGNARVRDGLAAVAFECGCEIAGIPDLRHLQLCLSEFPHGGFDEAVQEDVRTLFPRQSTLSPPRYPWMVRGRARAAAKAPARMT